MTVDKPLANETSNNLDAAYKRIGLNSYIAGQTGEGHVIQVITGANSTIQIMNCHVEGFSEELDF